MEEGENPPFNESQNAEKQSESFLNLTDNPENNTEDSMSKHLMHNFQITENHEDNLNKYLNSNHLEEFVTNSGKKKEEYEFYFKRKEKVENKETKTEGGIITHDKTQNNVDEEENDLEAFYERKQSFMEEALGRKSFTSKNSKMSNSNLSIRNSTPKVSSTGDKKKQKNFITNTSTNLSQSTRNVNRNTINVVSYDQFKNAKANRSTKNSPDSKPNNNSRMMRSSSQRSLSVSRNNNSSINKEKPSLKLKITHDTVEDISVGYKSLMNTKKQQRQPTLQSQQTSNTSVNTFRKGNKNNPINNPKNNPTKNSSTPLTLPNSSLKITQSIPQSMPITTKDKELNLSLSENKFNGELTKERAPEGNNNMMTIQDLNSNDNNLLNLNSEENLENPMLGKRLSLRNSKLTNNYTTENKMDTHTQSSEVSRKMTLQSEIITKSIMDENYADEIRQIYVKRRATKSNNSIIEGDSSKDNKENTSEFYKRNVLWKKDIFNKSMQLKEVIENKKMEECSFTPKVTKASRKILSKSLNHAHYDTDDFYSKNMKWKQQVEKFKQNQHLLNERKQYEECLFQPMTNRKGLDPLVGAVTGDYIYKKNIDWLKKVNENRKIKDLEMQQEMRDKSKHETIRQRLAKSRSGRSILHNLNKNNTYEAYQDSVRLEEEKSEDRLKKDLISPGFSASNVISSIRSLHNQTNVSYPYREVEKETIDQEINQIKDLIVSLKNTLEENKYLYSGQNENENENEKSYINKQSKYNKSLTRPQIDTTNNSHYINFNDSYQTNTVNMKSPTMKRNYSLDKSRFKKSHNFNTYSTLRTSEAEYIDKYKKLMQKYEKEQEKREEEKNQISQD